VTTFTQTHLDNLREMFASGVSKATYDGKTIEYRSMAELERAIARIEGVLGQAASRQVYPRFVERPR